MTYNVGDPGHVKAHGDLVSTINVELARFGLTGALPIKEEGAEGHLDDHNAIRAKLDELATVAGQSFSTPLPPVRQLGDGSHTDDHNILDECASEVATWPAWNAATGGLEQSIANYNGTGERWMVHTFTGNGTFTVTRGVQPFRVLLVGGGGGGGYHINYGGHAGAGGGQGGRKTSSDSITLSEGPHTVTIGGQGSACGAPGGTTSFTGVTSAGGGGTGGNCRDAPNSHNGGGGLNSNITGTAVDYGVNGTKGGNQYNGGRSGSYGGGGGGSGCGWGGDACHGSHGRAGVAIVAYRIG